MLIAHSDFDVERMFERNTWNCGISQLITKIAP